MSGNTKIIDDEEIILSNKKIISIVLNELEDYKNRRIGPTTLHEIFRTFWGVVASELVMGNRVITPIGTFRPKIEKLGLVNWKGAGIRKKLTPRKELRITIRFYPSATILKSMHHLLERYDAQQVNRNIQVVSRRRLVRNSRPRKRPPNETVGD